jgi:hypothetical protein
MDTEKMIFVITHSLSIRYVFLKITNSSKNEVVKDFLFSFLNFKHE